MSEGDKTLKRVASKEVRGLLRTRPEIRLQAAWFERLQRHARNLLKQDIPVVLAGDYNVAPAEIDIYPTTSWDDDALVQPESRATYAKLIKQGWVDAVRARYERERVYTFWRYWRNSWQPAMRDFALITCC